LAWPSRRGCATRRSSTGSPPACGTSRRCRSWPSPPRSTRTSHSVLRPGEEGRCFFQELVLHPQPADLFFHLSHVGTLHRTQLGFGLGVLTPPGVHPVPQGSLIDLQ